VERAECRIAWYQPAAEGSGSPPGHVYNRGRGGSDHAGPPLPLCINPNALEHFTIVSGTHYERSLAPGTKYSVSPQDHRFCFWPLWAPAGTDSVAERAACRRRIRSESGGPGCANGPPWRAVRGPTTNQISACGSPRVIIEQGCAYHRISHLFANFCHASTSARTRPAYSSLSSSNRRPTATSTPCHSFSMIVHGWTSSSCALARSSAGATSVRRWQLPRLLPLSGAVQGRQSVWPNRAPARR
jgi:hypothetical protein